MIEPHAKQIVLADLLASLGFQPAAPDKAYGSVAGNPVALTVLGGEPLALLLAFKIRQPHPPELIWPDDIAALVAAKRGEASLENGIAWLSLDNLAGESAESIAHLIASFARRLADAEVALPDGCVECTSREDVELVYADGRCSRLCAECRGQLDADISESDRQLNGFNFTFALTLPLMAVYVSILWSFLWVLLDIGRERRQSDVLLVHPMEAILVLGGLAVAAGYPVGIFARRLGLAGNARWVVSAVIVLVSCALGEWLYVVWSLDNETGVLAPLVAANILVDVVIHYQPSWKVAKVIVALAITGGCCLATHVRHNVAVKV